MANVADIDILMLRRSPAKSQRKRVLKEQLLFLKYNEVQIGCVSQHFKSKEVYCEHHIPPHAHIFSHMKTTRVMAQENKFVVHHCHFRPCDMSLPAQ